MTPPRTRDAAVDIQQVYKRYGAAVEADALAFGIDTGGAGGELGSFCAASVQAGIYFTCTQRNSNTPSSMRRRWAELIIFSRPKRPGSWKKVIGVPS